MLRLMKLIAAVLTGVSLVTFVFHEAKVSVAQTAKSDKIKCPRCGFMNPAKNKDGTPNTDCDKCGYSIVTFAADKGQLKIDPKVLATYSPQAKAIYNLFRNKCSKCHTLARPINTDLSPTKWEEYVKRMMSKPGSGIKPSEAKQIWQFLVYDTVKRRTKFFNTLPEKEKQIAQKVVAILEKNATSN